MEYVQRTVEINAIHFFLGRHPNELICSLREREGNCHLEIDGVIAVFPMDTAKDLAMRLDAFVELQKIWKAQLDRSITPSP